MINKIRRMICVDSRRNDDDGRRPNIDQNDEENGSEGSRFVRY